MDMQKATEVVKKIEAAYEADTYTDAHGVVWTGVESDDGPEQDFWSNGNGIRISNGKMMTKMIHELMWPEDVAPVEDPRADLKRATEIRRKIEKARDLAQQAKNTLTEAAELAAHDTYEGVRAYDQRDIRDMSSVFRVSVIRPINALCVRWDDIVHGRHTAL